MWRLCVFLFFLLLIASTGYRESWKRALLETRAIVWPKAPISGSPTSARELQNHAPALARDAARSRAVNAPPRAAPETTAPFPVAPIPSDAAAKQSDAWRGVKEGREGRLPQKTFETRDGAMRIPLLAQAAELESTGTTPDPRITAQVQNELMRLGCYKGPIDNIWGRASARAARKVRRLANLRLDSSKPTAETLAMLKGVTEPLCGSRRPGEDKQQQTAPSAKEQGRLPTQISPSAVASPDGGAADGDGDARNRKSYLPPWMRNSRMADAEPDSEPRHAASRTSPPAHAARRAAQSHRHSGAAKRSSSPHRARHTRRHHHRKRRYRRGGGHRRSPLSLFRFFFN
jgi:hypothetical protein